MAGWRHLQLPVALKRNKELTCKFCDKPRFQLSRMCLYHFNRWKRTGHVDGHIRHLKFFKGTIAEVAEIIRLNRKHLLIQNALGFIDRILYNSNHAGTPGLNRAAERYLRKISEVVESGKIDNVAILEVVAAIVYKHHIQNSAFLNDDNFLATLGTRFIHLAPGIPAVLKVTPRRQIERLLWRNLGHACLSIRDGVNQRNATIHEKKKRESLPFKLTD